nr:MAG TPA: hypothetical protein [Caudoviricetes sp.]
MDGVETVNHRVIQTTRFVLMLWKRNYNSSRSVE